MENSNNSCPFFLALAFFFFFPGILSFGQNNTDVLRYGDSLHRIAENVKPIELKAEKLLELSFFWSDYDTAKAFNYIKEASLVLSEKRESAYYKGILSFYRASVDFETDPQRAKKRYLEADRFLTKTTDNRALRYRARLWGSYGAILQREEKSAEYLEILLQKVIPIAKQIRDTVLLANNYQNVAITLMNLEKYQHADQYYQNAIQLLTKVNEGQEQRFVLFVNAAQNSLFQNKLPPARQLLDKVAVINSTGELSSYLFKYHTVEGSYWQKVGDINKALLHFDQGIKAAETLQSSDLIASVYFGKFEALSAFGQLTAAKESLLKALALIEIKPLLRNRQRAYYSLAELETRLGNYKQATRWYEKLKLVNDTLSVQNSDARTLELEKKYQTAEKENELLQVKTAHQRNQLSLQYARVWLLFLGSICIVLAMIGLLWYTSQKNSKKLALQKELLIQEELKSIKQREKLQLFNAMVQGQDKERSRIARDLHDSLGGMLAGVKLRLSAFANTAGKYRDTQVNESKLDPVILQLDQSITELRRVARNMMPESLLYLSLEDALKDLCKAMEPVNTEISFEAFGLRKEYDQAFLIAIYRIVQELLTNAVKHSNAKQIWVQASENDQHFYLSVEDNGRGFDYSKTVLEGLNMSNIGIGLSNIRNRVEILNGTLEIDTAAGEGSLFHIDITLNG